MATKKTPPATPGNGYLDSLRDLSAFPLLTEEISLPSAPSGIGGAATADVGTRASAAIREVLGWRPKPGDARGFNAALEQCFQLRNQEGRVVSTYTPRGYAMMADLGAVTGAQASLLNRARAAVDMVRPLIQSLTPLATTTVPAEYEPIRSMVIGELDAMVSELAQEGGPRIQKVDDLFSQLLGSDIVRSALTPGARRPGIDPIEQGLLYGIRLHDRIRKGLAVDGVVQRHGHLYTLQQRMGLNRPMVNTVEDERLVSNFMTAEDTIFSLWLTWWQERRSFGRIARGLPGKPPEPFLGTQLVLVSRSLSVVAEAVQELNFSLDSVFIGAPERTTIRLEFLDGSPSLYLSELLQWIDDLASTTGPRYLQDAGKDGVIAITDTLKVVRDRVAATAVLVATQSPSPALAAPRVQFAIRKLAAQLIELVELTDDFGRTAQAEALFETAPSPVLQQGPPGSRRG